jgi:hypothetical protein
MLGYNPLPAPTINVSPSASIATAASTSTTASTSSTQNAVNNEASGLNSILNLASQGAQIAGSVKYQRQQSGASARRQSLIAQCGRAPLLGRQRKNEYRKCKADYQASLSAPIGGGDSGGDINKNIGGGSSSMKFVYIGLGVLALGGIAYLALKKK